MEADVDGGLDLYSAESDYYNLNESAATNETIVHYVEPRGYSTLAIIISSILLTFMMIVVVIGNMLVIIAIATEKTLKNMQNWFIASLAVADFFVGLLIMPFSLANELMGYWIFGSLWCSIHSALDVLLCTSSIMNICLISLDRYWSITQAVDYLKKRTPVRTVVMIGMVWALSGLISIPPLLGWRRDPDAGSGQELPQCKLSSDIGYVLYSALGSFYIPSCIMVFVYIQIYFAARKRARRGVRKAPRPKPKSKAIIEESITRVSVSGGSSPKVPLSAPPYLSSSSGGGTLMTPSRSANSPTRAVTFQEPLIRKNEIIVKPEITVESPEDSSAEVERECVRLEECSVEGFGRTSGRYPSSGLDSGSESVDLGLDPGSNDGVEGPPLLQGSGLENGGGSVEERRVRSSKGGRRSDEGLELTVNDLENKITELQSNGSSLVEEGLLPESPKRCSSKRPKLHFLRVEKPTTIWRTTSSLSINGDVHILGTLSQSCSRLQLDMDPVSDVEPSSSDSGAVNRCAVVKPLKFRLCRPFFGKKSSSTTAKARRDVLDVGKLPSPKEIRDPEREKRRIARKKEKRATLILGLIMGSFILCWLPFFFLYIFDPLCPTCIASWGFAIAFWLGYMNSALNPVIYTIFNKDFRRAFRRILFK